MAHNDKRLLTITAFSLALLHVLFEYFTGGVATHYPLADASYPGISNWWGLISYPTLAWLALSLIERRRQRVETDAGAGLKLKNLHFLAGFAFGLCATLLWQFDQEAILQYFILLPLGLALFLRIYLPETSLGFVLGMTYSFGPVLPIAFAAVIQTAGFVIYSVFNRGGRHLLRRLA